MITIRKEKKVGVKNGLNEVVVELDVDTSSELPGVTDIEGRYLHQGSTALVISEKNLYILGGDEVWYN